MPITPTYPGVYVQEIPSGVRTITGVATSITAFVGRTLRGPVNTPVTITGFADFERTFGGLWLDGPLSYAVRDFYTNGGGRAIVVRLYKSSDGASSGKAALTVGTLGLEAADPGSWGNALNATVDHVGITDEVAQRYQLRANDLFNLVVEADGIVERFANLTVVDGPRRVDRVLAQQSRLVRLAGTTLPSTNPALPAPADSGQQQAQADSLGGTRKRAAKQEQSAAGAAAALAPVTSSLITRGDGGSPLNEAADFLGSAAEKTGVYALEQTDLFNLLCIPPDTRDGDTPGDVYRAAMRYCAERRAVLIVDPPADWRPLAGLPDSAAVDLAGIEARNAALYFPRVTQADPLREGQLDTFVPCGLLAGVIARTDAQRGVWKAPAGVDATLNGVQGLATNLTDAENGLLNPLGINCLRSFAGVGQVAWGARTLRGADQLADEYKYIPVRRLALYIEESLYRGTQWAVFEPNDELLWSQMRLNVGAFMHNLFRQGAFKGQTPREAYFVKCDGETTTQNDINQGIVNILVGFAPLKPAEFVMISLQQMAGQIAA